ncbi:MAG: Asp-tRNA(Asn)/Glu-tRNA(Gln) amidotransferase subunit GatC [Cyanobacteria bacterium J06632_22]
MIDLEQVRKVALLARLDLTDAEEQQLTEQLSSILEYVEQLGELDTADVPPTTRAIEVSNISRVDQLAPFGEREEMLGGAPDREDSFFKVPKILSSDEG